MDAATTEQIREGTYAAIAALLPQNAQQAMVGAHAALIHWRAKSDAARVAFHAWAALDAKGGSVRVQAAKELQESGMAPTVADKQASDHPAYKAHKAELSRLAGVKDDAELAAAQAFETLQNQREYLRGFNTVFAVNADGHIVVQPLG